MNKLVPVFKTKEQEESFFRASRRHLADGKKLEWEDTKKKKIKRLKYGKKRI